MKKWKKTILWGFGAFFVAAAAIMALKILFVDFVVDFWWFQSQEMTLFFFAALNISLCCLPFVHGLLLRHFLRQFLDHVSLLGQNRVSGQPGKQEPDPIYSHRAAAILSTRFPFNVPAGCMAAIQKLGSGTPVCLSTGKRGHRPIAWQRYKLLSVYATGL